MEDLDNENDGLEDDGADETGAQTVLSLAAEDSWGKDGYLLFVQMLTQAHGHSRALYDGVIAKVRAFDPGFAERLTAIQSAEDEAVRYATARLEGRDPRAAAH